MIYELVFNLHDASQWVEEYNNFSFRSFYNFIVDFFESARGHRDLYNTTGVDFSSSASTAGLTDYVIRHIS
jgi:hypothetical protein